MPLTFDPAEKRIILDTNSVTATELYSRWCDWVVLSDNLKYLPAFRSTGGDDLGSGLRIPPYYFLMNGWRVRPMEANHNLTITGNLFVDEGGVPVVSTVGTYQVNVNYTVPVQAQAISTGGGSGATAAEVWSYANRQLTSGIPTPEQSAAATWGRAIEGVMTAESLVRIILAALTGKTAGIGTPTEHYRDAADTKDRVVATFDANGNRITVSVDGT